MRKTVLDNYVLELRQLNETATLWHAQKTIVYTITCEVV